MDSLSCFHIVTRDELRVHVDVQVLFRYFLTIPRKRSLDAPFYLLERQHTRALLGFREVRRAHPRVVLVEERRLSKSSILDAHMVAGWSPRMARPRTLCSALASLQGSAESRRNGGFGMHVETTSAMVVSSYAHGAKSTLSIV